MPNLPNVTTYSASFPPAHKQRRDTDRLPVIVPVGFATNFLFGDHRLRKGPPLSERLRDARRSISLGLSAPKQFRTIHWSTDKPIVRSQRPQDIPTVLPAAGSGAPAVTSSDSNESVQSHDDDEDDDWDELATKRRYTSVTANAAEEGVMHLPSPPAKKILTSTWETDCDPVRNMASWTRWKLPRPISVAWDTTHTRVVDGMEIVNKALTSLPRIPSQSSLAKASDNMDVITKPTLSDPIPGYTGYQPHLPIAARQADDHMMSVARSSYRKLPHYEYRPSHYGHRAPFSKMVSLIAPHNPFNKLLPTEPLKL